LGKRQRERFEQNQQSAINLFGPATPVVCFPRFIFTQYIGSNVFRSFTKWRVGACSIDLIWTQSTMILELNPATRNQLRAVFFGHFSVVDRNVFEMTEKK